mmetsp:Transcript_19662/g.63196  ORF Transcript_19662/g.63196 Transcript_19662/m.63196 type:complete len:245 (-) Transcript_19662:877-1611(-)
MCAQLREYGSFETLQKYVFSEVSADAHLRNAQERQQAIMQAVLRLENSLSNERAEHRKDEAKHAGILVSLKKELHLHKKNTNTDGQYFSDKSNAHSCGVLRSFHQLEYAHTKAVCNLQNAHLLEIDVGEQTVRFFKHKHQASLMDLKVWQARHELTYSTLTADLDLLLQERASILTAVSLLRRRYKHHVEIERLLCEREISTFEFERDRISEFARMDAAALAIQAACRDYCSKNLKLLASKIQT